ncbi:hypothetical protein HUJ04_005136 [Dendroctonus ponderosae]|nr:hypothetical protein HUJ04_005136 [Dendroctonus ponderosae]
MIIINFNGKRSNTTLEGNQLSTEIKDLPSGYLDTTEQPGPPDSHEAMNNREFIQQRRVKRSFEFLVGLINNNSKYEVIKPKPTLTRAKEMEKKTDVAIPDATTLLLELLSKIVTYPDRWRKVHEMLRTLDEDLNSSHNILRNHQLQQKHRPEISDMKRNYNVAHSKWKEGAETTTHKWPTFDDIQDTTSSGIEKIETTHKIDEKYNDKTYQKNFAYHKVTGKPTHLKKNPTAYIAVSAISPKPSESEEDFLLETELHQLKPWKNKHFGNTV